MHTTRDPSLSSGEPALTSAVPTRSPTPPGLAAKPAKPTGPVRSVRPAQPVGWLMLLLAVTATLAALAVPLAPVTQQRVTLSWPPPGQSSGQSSGQAPGPPGAVNAVAMPLLPYQPVQLTATLPCEGPGTVLLSTVPLQTDPGAPRLPGLRVERTGDQLVITSYAQLVARAPQPSGACQLQVRSDPDRTAALLNGRVIGEVGGDVRPVVAGVFTDGRGDVRDVQFNVVTDTRFQTSMTPLKAALVALAALALLGAVLAGGVLDRRSRSTRRVALLPHRWWRPRAWDVIAITGLVGWALIGPITVDDGYIAGIVRTRDTQGYIGNLYRWLNAPEAPFGWFYELYALWARVSPVPLWLRIPSTVLGVACWVLLSRALLPRLGRLAVRPAAMWVAAAVFGCWWLPFNLGLRPEPWVAVAVLLSVLAVERAVVTHRLVPVLAGLVVASAATAVTPTGVIAFTPFVAGLVPLLRALRRRPELPRVAVLAVLVAAPTVALPLAFGDQTLASVAEATRIRTLIGGGLPWYEEVQRYANLLSPDLIEGVLQRRVPVLLTLLGLAGLAWVLARWRSPGLARGPLVRTALTLLLSLVAMAFTPTKWTHHFGALAGIGAAVLVVAIRAWSRPRVSAAAVAAGTAALAFTGGMALAGRNQWPYVSNYGITWSTIPPQLAGLPASVLVLVGGLLLAAVSGAAAAWAKAGSPPGPSGWVVFKSYQPRSSPGALSRLAGRLPSPGLLALGLVIATVALQLGSVARAALRQHGGYSLAGDSVAALTGSSCGLADHLRVETDPRAGLLVPSGAGGARLDGFLPVPDGPEVAGVSLPGWVATGSADPARATTGWYRLDGAPAVVITLTGDLGPGGAVVAQFRDAGGRPLRDVAAPDAPGAPQSRDIRVAVPPAGARLVRFVVSAVRLPGTPPPAFSQPRSPRTQPMTQVLPPGTTAVVDWPVAFLYPCLRIAGTPDGLAELPSWRVGAPTYDASGEIVITPATGGSFVTARTLVQAQRLPVYLDTDPVRDVATLSRWQPLTAFATPALTRSSEVVGGWQRRGHLHVPGVG